jgi:hypothetical protein
MAALGGETLRHTPRWPGGAPKTAHPLPDTPWGRQKAQDGRESEEDALANWDMQPRFIDDESVRQFYRAVMPYFASALRYAFHCPHCRSYFPDGARMARVFRRHLAPGGSDCGWRKRDSKNAAKAKKADAAGF